MRDEDPPTWIVTHDRPLTVEHMVRALRKVAQSNGPSIGQQSLMRRLADALEADDE